MQNRGHSDPVPSDPVIIAVGETGNRGLPGTASCNGVTVGVDRNLAEDLLKFSDESDFEPRFSPFLQGKGAGGIGFEGDDLPG